MSEIEYISVTDAARMLDVSPRTLCKYCNEFHFIEHRVLWARRWAVRREDVERLVRLGLTGRALAHYTTHLRHPGQPVTVTAQEAK